MVCNKASEHDADHGETDSRIAGKRIIVSAPASHLIWAGSARNKHAVAPHSASRAFILGSARAALISVLSLSTTEPVWTP
jgi:hypothetical protein